MALCCSTHVACGTELIRLTTGPDGRKSSVVQDGADTGVKHWPVNGKFDRLIISDKFLKNDW